MNIVFCDIDGTFQEIGSEVATINYDAVTALQKQGDHFVFVTGRGYDQLSELLDSMPQACDVIFSNGAGNKFVGEEVAYGHCLSLKQTREVVSILEERNIFYHIHTNEGIILPPISNYQQHLSDLRQSLTYMQETGQQIMDYKENFFTNACRHVDSPIAYLAEHPELHILKVELMEADDEESERLRGLLSNDECYVFCSFIKNLEIVHAKSSKGFAIQEFMTRYPEAKSFGIGDGENDLAMFNAVDVSVAVGNAVEHVKEKAQYTTDTCINGGVGKFILESLIH